MHLLDPFTLQAVELQPLTYWKLPFKAALSRSDLAEFVVLDVELRDPEWRSKSPVSNPHASPDSPDSYAPG